MPDSRLVTVGKPKVGGSVFRAASGTTLPTDATTTLSSSTWADLGYISDAGVTNANSRTTQAINAWGGNNVKNPQTEKVDTFQFTMIEALNVDVLKVAHGDANVTGDLSTGVTVKVNANELEEACYVIDTVLNGTVLKRMVLPRAQVTEVADVVYNDSDALGYQVTVSCYPDSTGETHYEYLIQEDESES